MCKCTLNAQKGWKCAHVILMVINDNSPEFYWTTKWIHSIFNTLTFSVGLKSWKCYKRCDRVIDASVSDVNQRRLKNGERKNRPPFLFVIVTKWTSKHGSFKPARQETLQTSLETAGLVHRIGTLAILITIIALKTIFMPLLLSILFSQHKQTKKKINI